MSLFFLFSGSKDSWPNGFIKVPENVEISYETGFSDINSFSDNESKDVESKLLSNGESERVGGTENSSFEKGNCNQRHNFGYQNGGLNYSNNSNCQQNIFNNYITLNKFGGQLKNDNLVLDNGEVFPNQNHLLGQQNFLLKQQLAQQQRNQPSLQQILIQQQQNLYQQQQNQYSPDFRLVQQQLSHQQPINGLQNPHINYLQQSNLRDQLLLQQKQNQLILNNYSPSGNNFIHLSNNDDLMVVENGIPQHKFVENSLNHSNIYSSEYKEKGNRKSEDSVNEKGNTEVINRLGDDELGFDPFHETQKALADLMEKELLIQQNKQTLQHKNDQYYHQSPQNFPNQQHGFDGCQRGFNQLQVNMLNQQNNLMGGKLLSQIHSQQILNSSNQK